eukprot:g7267.t1
MWEPTIVSERVVVSESFACLRGYAGSVYKRINTEFRTNSGEPSNAIQGLHSNVSRSEEGFVVFVPVDRLTLLKSTPGALYSIMSFVADMATSLNSLRFFSHIYSPIDNSSARGSVWQAFAQAVGSYVSEIEKQLTHFEKFVQEKYRDDRTKSSDIMHSNTEITNSFTVIDFFSHLQNSKTSIDFVCSFIEDVRKSCNSNTFAPRDYACVLLSKLYTSVDDATLQDLACESPDDLKYATMVVSPLLKSQGGGGLASAFSTGANVSKDSYTIPVQPESSIMLYFFKMALGMYLLPLNTWMCEGKLEDPYNEFFVSKQTIEESRIGPSNIDLFRSKDDNVDVAGIWINGYKLIRDKSPTFLKRHVNDIFLCGKSEAVLRRILINSISTSNDATTPKRKQDNIKLIEELKHHIKSEAGDNTNFNLITTFDRRINGLFRSVLGHNIARESSNILACTAAQTSIEYKFLNFVNFTPSSANTYLRNELQTKAVNLYDGEKEGLERFFSGRRAKEILKTKDLNVRAGIPCRDAVEKGLDTDKTDTFSYLDIDDDKLGDMNISADSMLPLDETRTNYLGSINFHYFFSQSISSPIVNMSKETNSLLVQILIKNMHLTQILDKIRMCYFFSDIAAMEDFMLGLFGALDGYGDISHHTDMGLFERNIGRELKRSLKKSKLMESEKWEAKLE